MHHTVFISLGTSDGHKISKFTGYQYLNIHYNNNTKIQKKKYTKKWKMIQPQNKDTTKKTCKMQILQHQYKNTHTYVQQHKSADTTQK